MLKIQEGVKVSHHKDVVILADTRTSKFMKIRKQGWDFLQEYMTGENGEKLLDTLKKEDKKQFSFFVEDLKKKGYLFDQAADKAVSIDSFKKSWFMNTDRTSYFEVTRHCNLKCKFCYANPDYKIEDAPGNLETAKNIIDRAKKLNINKLIVTGGEPLLRPDIFDILTYAKKVIPEVYLATNGILIDEETAHRIKDCKVDKVSISIEGSTETTHDSLRGEGSFNKSITGIHNLKKAGFGKDAVKITATMNRKNIHELITLPEFAEQLGVEMTFSLFQPAGRGKFNEDLAFTEKQFIELHLKIMEAHQKGMNVNMENFSDRVAYDKLDDQMVPKIKERCGMIAKTLGIKADGSLYPCHFFFSSPGPGIAIGSIFDEDILEKMWEFYSSIPTVDQKEGCKDCSVRYFCGGSCYAGGYFRDGTFSKANPACKSLKKIYTAILESLGEKNESEYLNEKLVSYID